MTSHIIYRLTNVITNKQYVGKTKHTAEERFQAHVYEATHCAKSYLHKAIVKYGKESFLVEILESNISDEHINEREVFWIKECATFVPNGYNLTKGGDGGDTSKSLSYIEAMIQVHNRRSPSDYATFGMLGKSHSDETKEKQSKARKEFWANPENKIKRKDTSGSNNSMSKPLTIDSIYYSCLAEASRQTGISEHKLRELIKKTGSRELCLHDLP